MNETYLGDGLYASIEEGMVRLRAPHESEDHIVYLEWQVYAALIRFLLSKGWEIPSE